MTTVIRINLLYSQTALIIAGPGVTLYWMRMRVRLKTNLAIEMSQNNTLTNGKLQRCQTQRRNTQITAEIMQTCDLLKFALARSNGSSFLLRTQYEMPFINKSEVTKSSKDRKIYRKCTNGTNRRSRVWPVCFYIYIIANPRQNLLNWNVFPHELWHWIHTTDFDGFANRLTGNQPISISRFSGTGIWITKKPP